MYRWSWLIAGVLVVAVPGAGQAQSPWQWHEVPAAGSTVFAVLWQHGYDDDAPADCGAALALAECRLARARQRVPAASQAGVQVLDDATVAFVLVPAVAAADGVEFCRALLDDRIAIDADLAAGAIARAALAADDAEWLYPGPVLAGRARRSLLCGAAARAVAGSARTVQALTPARLRELLQQPVAVLAVGVGAVSAEIRGAALRLLLPAPPVARVQAVAALATPPPSAADVQPHPRVDGPLVSLAFAVPAGIDRAALAVAIEVARGRAARALRLRGGEARARTPLVSWSWLAAEPLVAFYRRGIDGADPAGPFAELDALLADLVARPPTAAEYDIAVRTLRAESGFGSPPIGPALPGWAVSSLLVRHRAIGPGDVDGVTAASAHAALRETCEPARGYRGGLVPAAVPGSR